MNRFPSAADRLFCSVIVCGMFALLGACGSGSGSSSSAGADNASLEATTSASVPVINQQIKVLSYNTGFASTPSSGDQSSLITLLESESADIIGLQELGSSNRQVIEQGLPGYDFYFGGEANNSNPIALKTNVFTVLLESSIAIEVENCSASYVISYVHLQINDGQQFVVFNDHFCRANPDGHVLKFIAAIADILPDLPKIITGDLNANDTSPVMDYLLRQGALSGQSSTITLLDTWVLLETGVSKADSGAPIDWVLISDPNIFMVVDKSVVDDAGLSDHNPVTATLALQ